MSSKHDLLMFSTSPQPSGFDETGQGIPSPQNVTIPCHPSEDIDVTDAMRRPSADIISLISESSLCEAFKRNDSGRNRNFPIEENAPNPESATRLKQIIIEGAERPGAGRTEREEIGRGFFPRDPSSRSPVYQNQGPRQVFRDGLDKVDRRNGRAENLDLRWTEFGLVNDEIDFPDRCAGAVDCDDVATLRKSYHSLLEKHQRFIVSYAHLHEMKGGLENRVRELELELADARLELEEERRDKTQLADRVDSLQKMVNVFKEKIPKLAPADNTNDNSSDGQGEWTSSLKEELRQTMLLAVYQQKELNKLDAIIKRQNEAIKRLSHATSHSGNDQKTFSLQLNEHEMLQRHPEQQLRHKPEGSSVLDLPVGERSKVRPSSGTTEKLAQKTFGSEFEKPNRPDEKLLTKPKDVTSPTVNKPNLRPTSAKQPPAVPPRVCDPPNDTQFRYAAAGVKGPPTQQHRGKVQASEHSMNERGCGGNADPENSSFVFVDRNHVEIRICPLCNAEFLSDSTTLEEFITHVSVCSPPEDCLQCPVCSERFDKKLTHSEFEAHVNRHFDEDHFQCLSPTEGK